VNALLLSVLLTCSVIAEDKPAAVPQPVVAAHGPTDLSGTWSGTWLSHTNGHDGPIAARFVKIDDDNYRVHFNGRFWGLFPFQYNLVLTVTERKEDSLTMSGGSNLGLFGKFSYVATVTDTDFVASYCSKRDQGVFTMSRLCQCR